MTCESDFVQLTWVTTEDNNSPIIDYIVYYTDSSAADPYELVEGPRLVANHQESIPGTTLTGIVSGLKPWVTYEFHVAARNELGMSDRASQSDVGGPAVCVTPQAAPTKNPEDVCTRLSRPHQLVIVWKVGDNEHPDF